MVRYRLWVFTALKITKQDATILYSTTQEKPSKRTQARGQQSSKVTARMPTTTTHNMITEEHRWDGSLEWRRHIDLCAFHKKRVQISTNWLTPSQPLPWRYDDGPRSYHPSYPPSRHKQGTLSMTKTQAIKQITNVYIETILSGGGPSNHPNNYN